MIYTDFSIWDKFIDPRDHMAKFVKDGRYVPYSTAQNEFGKPRIFYRGVPASFKRNRGLAGNGINDTVLPTQVQGLPKPSIKKSSKFPSTIVVT